EPEPTRTSTRVSIPARRLGVGARAQGRGISNSSTRTRRVIERSIADQKSRARVDPSPVPCVSRAAAAGALPRLARCFAHERGGTPARTVCQARSFGVPIGLRLIPTRRRLNGARFLLQTSILHDGWIRRDAAPPRAGGRGLT